jgi:hypothetical protein
MAATCWSHGPFTGFKCPVCNILDESRAREDREREEREKAEKRQEDREYRQREEDRERRERKQEEERLNAEPDSVTWERARIHCQQENAKNETHQRCFNDGCSQAATLILAGQLSEAKTKLLSLIHDVETLDGSEYQSYDNELLPYFLLFEVRTRNGFDGTATLLKGLARCRAGNPYHYDSVRSPLATSLTRLQRELGQATYPYGIRVALEKYVVEAAERSARGVDSYGKYKSEFWKRFGPQKTVRAIAWVIGIIFLFVFAPLSLLVALAYLSAPVIGWVLSYDELNKVKAEAVNKELARLKTILKRDAGID